MFLAEDAQLETKFLWSCEKMFQEDEGKTEPNVQIMEGRKLTLGFCKNQGAAL